jgi:uncharacterized Tic20 family protein
VSLSPSGKKNLNFVLLVSIAVIVLFVLLGLIYGATIVLRTVEIELTCFVELVPFILKEASNVDEMVMV